MLHLGDRVVFKNSQNKEIYVITEVGYTASHFGPLYKIISKSGAQYYWYDERTFEKYSSPQMSLIEMVGGIGQDNGVQV